ncbi:MAG: MFS transporter, partial [Nocardioides sp.]
MSATNPRRASAEVGSRMWPIYVGGFIGPFGGAMVSPMLPELRKGLDTSLEVVASSLTVYLIPFALCMLFSGTLAEIWGRRRTVQIAYLSYAAASLLCALAPQAPLFLAGRAAQGIANAFTTPILMSALADATDTTRLGRALGRFGSVQAAGLTFAPVIGGLCAAVDWRLAFWITLAAALALAVV